MGKVNRRHVGKTSVADLVRRRDEREPGFQSAVDARVAELAIARKIRLLREKRGLTQAQLAEKAGTGQAAIARIESGRTVPKLDLLARVASALGARLDVKLTAIRG